MKIYLSGPMTGLPNFNRDTFNEVATVLRSVGYEVFNPAEVQLDNGTWEQYMREDIKGMMDCDRVLLLPGWQKSAGANVENRLARDVGMPRRSLVEWLAFSEEGHRVLAESRPVSIRLLEQLLGTADTERGNRERSQSLSVGGYAGGGAGDGSSDSISG
ncbi:DUF4406 domain-containing protein [Alicyclobacillus dauci]|uniref:DUF4406 domain-containing protein n=1 Tax=Alicyclobacillus dauci TaxID=1475485 RepID=A0ABY6Z725_9BACL|nr:DUF4406 domain-containing protein [Alicyclobacillus dauci]WAH38589.1 DUF4406 domain-containing protein [Alicyclobacillus dauci]